MSGKKKASEDLCKRVMAIMEKHAREAEEEIKSICELAMIDGQIDTRPTAKEFLIARMLGQVRHHLVDKDGHPHTSSEEATLFQHHWPGHK